MLGFRVQDTLLGNYTDSRGKSKLVVACRDFTEGGKRLIEFAQLKNTCIDSEQNGYGKELSSILQAHGRSRPSIRRMSSVPSSGDMFYRGCISGQL